MPQFHSLHITLCLVMLALAAPLAAQQNTSVTTYTLNTGDKVQITVFEEPDLSVEAIIDDTGAISYPLLGEVRVSGLTSRELEQRVADGLRGRFLINPRVPASESE